MAIPLGPYSPAFRAGDLLFTAGQIGLTDSGELASGFAAQVEQALGNLADVLGSNGAGIDKVVKTTVFVTDMNNFPEMNDLYLKTFSDPLPARSTVAVAGLPKGALFEIEAVAHARKKKYVTPVATLPERAYAASPLGIVASISGCVLAIVFIIKFSSILDNVQNADLRAAIQALEITVVSVWIAVALWGWYLIRDGMERSNTNRRLNDQQSALSRIEQSLSEMDHEKVVVAQKSRSFWNWRRNED